MLQEFLSQHRAAIVSEWFELILAEYPQETAKFLSQQRDPFANPVGAGLRKELGPLFDGVVSGVDCERLLPALDRIIRVRAVQDFKPSEALGFLLGLKRLIRMRVTASDLEFGGDLAELEARIDRLVLAAFDVYTGCREQVCEIRVEEIRNRSLKMMERLNEWRAQRDGFDDSDVVEPH
jgi:hypothetical protein